MPIHVVEPGECLTSIAAKYGLLPSDIYDAPANAPLKQKRPDPNLLHPGDKISVPETTPRSVERPTGNVHLMRVTVPKRRLRVALKNSAGKPLANEPYKLTGSGVRAEGKLDGDGMLDTEIPARVQELELEVFGSKRRILLGHLNPLRDTTDGGVTGVQARLRNLGYDVGEVDGDFGPRTRAALLAFQEQQGLDTTGEVDDATLKALEGTHGS